MKNPKIFDGNLAYLIGFFKGDGYFTYGRVGVDTISPDVANKLVEIFSKLSEKKIKIEVYGNPERFLQILQKDSLIYPKRNAKHSDYVKIRIDSVEFANKFKNIISEFETSINEANFDAICKYLQGFFDAEAYVSPQGTIEIDLCKDNEKLLINISKLLDKVSVKNKVTSYKSKIRLVVLGGTKNISNIIKFKNKIDFYLSIKNQELKDVIEIYSKSKDHRNSLEISQLILSIVKKEKSIELKNLMKNLNLKYQTMLRCVNVLIKENKLQKIKKQKRIFLELSPISIPIGK